MPQSTRITCKWCQGTHSISEGCSSGAARPATAARQENRTQEPSVSPPSQRDAAITDREPAITEEGSCVCPTCGMAHTPRAYASRAEQQRAYRARKRGD